MLATRFAIYRTLNEYPLKDRNLFEKPTLPQKEAEMDDD